MNKPKAFTNPWPEAMQLQKTKVTAYVPNEILGELKAKRLVQGTQTITINILIEKLLHECKRRGFNDFHDQEKFEQFVINSRLALPGEFVALSGDQSVSAPIPNGGSVAGSPGGPATSSHTNPTVSNVGGGSPASTLPLGTEAAGRPDVKGRSRTGSGGRKGSKG